MNKKIIIILIILCIAIGVRASGLNKPLYQDDTIFAGIAENKEYFSTNNVHLPLGNLIIIGVTSLLGISEWTLRFPTFIFAIGTILITYFFAKRRYGEKVALWTAFIMGISCWHIYGSLTNIAAEGGLVTFMIALTSFYFLEGKKDIITGLLLGGAILAKEFAVLLLPLFVLYLLTNKMGWKEIVKKMSCIVIGAIIVGTLFVSIDFFWNNLGAIKTLLGSIVKETYTTPTMYHMIYGLFKIALFASPLLLLFFPLYVMKEGKKSLSEFEVLYVVFMVSFFILVINQATEKVRYLLIIIPFLAIIAAKYIAAFELKRKEYLIISVISIIFLIGFAFMNVERNTISYEEQEKMLASIKSGKGIDVGLVSETGNSGFVINTNIVFLAYMLSIFAMIAIKAGWQKTGIIVLLALGIGYNLFVAEEYLWHGTSPNYEEVTQNIIHDLKEEKAKEPIYVIKDVSIIWYLQDDYETFYSLDTIQNTDERLDWFEAMTKTGGTIVVVDIPFINKEGRLWNIITACEEKKAYMNKGIEIGWVFSC
ncbi:glycosyltransferase family 39 protein [Candidatus Woesearchaeota archaeon]|nr:glycosyltransferase family 39 protein [Candidatus Woesearchaeota archaeon]